MRVPQNLSPAAAYAFGSILALVAGALQWSVLPLVGARIPFLFFLIAIGIAAFYAGRGPGLLVLVVGALNSVFQFSPMGETTIASFQDQLIILIYLAAGLALVYVGARFRGVYLATAESFKDLQRLHDLSSTLAGLPNLQDQLDLILSRLAELHGTRQGLISLYDSGTNTLQVASSLGFSAAAVERLSVVRGGEGACGLACLEGRRIIIEDVDQHRAFDSLRDLARQEGFRAVHSTPLLGRDGRILGAISLHFPEPHRPTEREMQLAEICARKVAVHMGRARAESRVRDADQRLRRIVNASAVPFTALAPVRDASGTIVDFSWTYVNVSAAETLKRSADELIGKRVAEVLPETWDEPQLFEHYVAVADRGEVREFDLRYERNGVDGWFHIVASPLEGDIAVWFADVTIRKQQELELRMADRRKDEFLATLAHELRNPLAPIRQAVTIAGKSSATAAQREWCNEVIERQVHHMALLLDDLLDVSRITRGVLQLRKQPTALAALIDSAVETARPIIDGKNHALSIDIPEADLRVNVDPVRLSQVVSNLLNNAAKYTQAGGAIRLSARTSGAALVLTVSDNGIGIAPSDLQAIFKMFAQVKPDPDRSEGGLGIGLALTKGLVELHGGTIVAESAGPNSGSSFTIRIPEAVLPGRAPSTPDVTQPRTLPSRHILVADDNRDAAQSLAVLLRSDGHHVTLAHDGAEALALFNEHRPEVALLDLGMPQMSGYEVARRIRSGESKPDATLIAITGWGQSSDRDRSAAAGFDHHLTKPLDYEELTALLALRDAAA